MPAPAPKLNPDTPGVGPVLSAAVEEKVRDCVLDLAAARGTARSAVIRELLAIGIAALDAAAG